VYTTNSNPSQSYLLEQHIRKLEKENGRLFEENQYQRQEYERFLDQLATMVIQTAVMQEVNVDRVTFLFLCSRSAITFLLSRKTDRDSISLLINVR
jgi:hypothetical protein